MDFHEVASIFPMMSDSEYNELVSDIRKNGLLEPIWIYEKKIIDGRNRYQACIEANVQPQYREWNGKGSLTAFVISLNLHRRHLSEAQRGMVGAKALPMFEAEAKKRQGTRTDIKANLPESSKGQARDQAAEMVNVSPRTVESAKKVLREGIPELIEAVESGEMAVSKAAQIAKLEPEEQREAVSKPHVAYNSGDNEWYTPSDIIESARKVLGGFDLDPASSNDANEIVKAKKFYDEAIDGLQQEWRGRVWMNPPYASNLIGKFCEKFLSSELDGGVVLVNNATETKWFQSLLREASAVCFPEGRIRFWHPRKDRATPLQGQAILYFGESPAYFDGEFSKYGTILFSE